MKTTIASICLLLLPLTSWAGYRTWTNAQGQTAELELLSVEQKGDQKVGNFKMKDGRVVQLTEEQLSDADAQLLADWKPEPEETSNESVFDEFLEGNLVRLDGSSLKSYDEHKTPAKYYIFYYTASWCPPCRAFTPTLVKWYEQNKNDNFELVLITSDREKKDMTDYAKKNKMPWPQVKHSKADDFKKKFNHGVRGIPSLIVCDLEGKNLGNLRGDLGKITEMVQD